jgi:mannose-1-phosphate guanylyltransferase/mannose-1-phosphate guanylyltransferase/phosphomannomutase
MAAGLGTRLAPLTDYLPKPLVPVANRPVLEHLLRRLARHGVREVAVNLHHHADAIRDAFGDGSRLGLEITWSYEPELLGTAGGVRRCREFLTEPGEPFFVGSADGLHAVDLTALARRHREARALATLTAKRIPEPERYGVCVVDDEGLITDFQEKPPPEEARSDLASCGMYVFEPRVFELYGEGFFDWARDVLPAALACGERLAVYETDAYWNDVGSVEELVNGNLDALRGLLDLGLDGLVDASAEVAGDVQLDGEVLIGPGARLAGGVRVIGPAVIGPRAVVERGAALRACVVLPGALVTADTVAAGGVVGQAEGLAEAWR